MTTACTKVLITGATDGLGKALAQELTARGATVLLHGRSTERLATTERELALATHGVARSYRADFASLSEVRRLAHDVGRDHPRIDVLVNNAGIGPGVPQGPREVSADGHELRFAVNYLAPFLLTTLLLPCLLRSQRARIVNVASGAQQDIDFDDVMLKRSYDGWIAYKQSKLAEILFTLELAQRLLNQGMTHLTVNVLHPASLMDTKLVQEYFGHAQRSVLDGVRAVLPLVLAAELEGVSGVYFQGSRPARARDQAYDTVARRRLWDLSEQLVAGETLDTRNHALGMTAASP